MRRLVAIIICTAVLMPAVALCTEGGEAGGGDEPEVEVKVPDSYYLRKIGLFPLELPIYAFKGVLWPISHSLGYLERKRVFERGAQLMSNKSGTFWVYPCIDWGAGNNFGGGPGFKYIDLFHRQYILSGSYRIRISLNQHADISMAKDDAFRIKGRPASIWTGFRWNRITNADYYGIGSAAPRSDRSRYGITDIEWDGQIFYALGWHVHLGGSLGYLTATTSPSTKGGYPAVDTTFGAANLPGFRRWLNYLKFGLGAAHDTRDNKFKPRKGGKREFVFYRYQCLNTDDFSFNEYVFDFTQFIPLWRPGRTLVLRNNWTFQQEIGSRRVPFYRLAELDYKSPLRGFKRGRFHDKSSVVFNFEYYFPVSRLLEGIIFVDTGKVFDGIFNFNFNNWKYSAGGGLNVELFRITLLKFRMAYGGEGINVIIGMTKSI